MVFSKLHSDGMTLTGDRSSLWLCAKTEENPCICLGRPAASDSPPATKRKSQLGRPVASTICGEERPRFRSAFVKESKPFSHTLYLSLFSPRQIRSSHACGWRWHPSFSRGLDLWPPPSRSAPALAGPSIRNAARWRCPAKCSRDDAFNGGKYILSWLDCCLGWSLSFALQHSHQHSSVSW